MVRKPLFLVLETMVFQKPLDCVRRLLPSSNKSHFCLASLAICNSQKRSVCLDINFGRRPQHYVRSQDFATILIGHCEVI